MIYELRTYHAAPGMIEALHERFRTLTLRIFTRHQMEVVGFWTVEPRDRDAGTLIYLLRFPSQEALDRAWASMRSDPEWRQGKAATERNGKLVDRIESQVLVPTDYSPLK